MEASNVPSSSSPFAHGSPNVDSSQFPNAPPPNPSVHGFPSACGNNGVQHSLSDSEKVSLDPSSPTAKKSFASLLKDSSPILNPSITMIPVSTYKGEPALRLSKEIIHSLVQPFKFTLVGKFSHGRPSMDETRHYFLKFGLKADFVLGHVDSKHILIRLKHEGDFNRLWAKEAWHLGRFPMRVFRWTPSWHPEKESPFFPVWVGLPGLLIHMFNKVCIFSIAKIFGEPLAIDQATSTLSRPSEARVLVQVDLLKKLPSRVFIDCGDEFSSFYQNLDFKNLPQYCKHCYKLGHDMSHCYYLHPKQGGINVEEAKNGDTRQAATNDVNEPKRG